MMKKLMRIHDLPPKRIEPAHMAWPSLIVLAALFLFGAVAGCFTASSVDGSAGSALMSYLQEFFSMMAHRPEAVSLLGRALIGAFKYHLLVFLLGLTLPGVALIPATMVARGFFLSFAVTAFVRVQGVQGLWLAVGAFGVQTLLTLPCLFALAQSGFQASLSLLGSVLSKKPVGKMVSSGYFSRFVVLSVVLVLSALFEALVTPALLSFLAGQMTL